MITKQVVVKEVVVSDDGMITLGENINILEDGVVIASIPKPRQLKPGDATVGESMRVSAIASSVWTDDVIRDYGEKHR